MADQKTVLGPGAKAADEPAESGSKDRRPIEDAPPEPQTDKGLA